MTLQYEIGYKTSLPSNHYFLITTLQSTTTQVQSLRYLSSKGVNSASTIINQHDDGDDDGSGRNGHDTIQQKNHDPTILSLSSLNKDKIREEILQYWMVEEMKNPTSKCTSRRARYCCYTYHDAKREYESKSSPWYWLDKELSSNLAGETGAVYIYKGALKALDILERFDRSKTFNRQHESARNFCETHYKTEESHRRFFDSIIPYDKRTRLLPLWRFAGYNLGLWPTLLGGTRALYVTVEAVESFVEQHFQEQIVPLRKEQTCPELLKLLEACCADEVHHKDDAAKQLLGEKSNVALNSWWVLLYSMFVQLGSSTAAEIARRL